MVTLLPCKTYTRLHINLSPSRFFYWCCSSVGKSGGFITHRSAVRSRLAPPYFRRKDYRLVNGYHFFMDFRGGSSVLVTALVCQSKGRGFKPRSSRQIRFVDIMAIMPLCLRGNRSSILLRTAKFKHF